MEQNRLSSEKSNVADILTKEKLANIIKDSPHLEEIKILKKWFSDYIDLFREEFGKLSENEKKCVLNTKNFLEPCQIEIFWLKEPDHQLIIQSNFKDRNDKEIIVHGPFNSHEFLAKVSPILKEVRWQKKIDRNSLHPRYYIDQQTYAQTIANSLHHFIDEVKRMQFSATTNVGYSRGHAIENETWVQSFRGNISNTDKQKDVEQIIAEIKNAAKQRAEAPVISPPSSPDPQEEKYDGYGIHLFPPIIIGKRIEHTPEQLLYGNTLDFSFDDKAFDTTFGQKIIIVNKDGYFFIESKQKTEALKILNLIMALGIFHDLPLYSVKEHELSQASFNRQTKDIGGMTWGMGSIRSYLFEEKWGRKSSVEMYEKKEIEKEKLEKIIEDARTISKFEKLTEELRLFNDANTHLANSEYAQSFIMSWSVIERYYSDLWRKKLDKKDIDEERLGKLTNSNQWSIDFIFEVLNLDGEIDDNFYDLLMELKKKRNRFYHRGKQVDIEDAKRCLTVSHQILLIKISNVKKGLPE